MNSMNIKTGDTVVILSGKDKGKKGKVLSASPSEQTVVVEGAGIVTRHQKPRRQGEPGGIIKKESAIRVCKVMRLCPKCDKPTRGAHKILGTGKKVRVCKRCGETI